MTFAILTHLAVFFLGALLGVAILAIVSINKPEPDDDDGELTDSELLDFMTRNDLGLSVIKQAGATAMWGVTTAMPVKVIGALNDDPRGALAQAAGLLLEKDQENG